ncbi:hypothetical protein H0266_15045 [Halobacillus locisalis]|uniref:Lipoprotein n=1 Tax=Halobacillus locisalis TaxID=220753 RepID=A0A838CVN6_9BACI|nr:hypothetical protein [Halobacillus locisalis]MBA2176212.1 hypothetical protein [Halobacillus locisalis]
MKVVISLISVSLLILLASCIQAEEGGVNTPEEAIRQTDKFSDIDQIYGSHEIRGNQTLILLKGTYTGEAIWLADVQFVKAKNHWVLEGLTNMKVPTKDMGSFVTRIESGEGYKAGYIKDGSNELQAKADTTIIDLDDHEGWGVWIQKAKSND